MIFFITLILFNLLLMFFNGFFASQFNLYDTPDQNRKFHKIKTPLTGGLIIILNILFYFFILEKIDFININQLLFSDKINLYIFIITSLAIYLFGIFDDKLNISANKKFILLLIIILPIVVLDSEASLRIIKLSFLSREYDIGYFSIIWTIICYLLLLNAINMFDGINLQVGLYSLFIFIFFILNDYNKTFFIALTVGITFFLILNFNSKSFLGDGGSYLLAFIIGYFFVKMYNSKIILNADQVALLMFLPGLDLMRLFVTRIIRKRHPFSADRNHLHHLLLKKFSYYEVIIIIQSIIFIPIIINLILGYTLMCLISVLIIYSIIVYKYI